MAHKKTSIFIHNYDILDKCCRRKEETDDNETARRCVNSDGIDEWIV